MLQTLAANEFGDAHWAKFDPYTVALHPAGAVYGRHALRSSAIGALHRARIRESLLSISHKVTNAILAFEAANRCGSR